MNATKQQARNVAKALTPFVNTLLLATAYAEVECERVGKIQRQVLANMGYPDLDPQQVYKIADDDAARYFAKMNEIHLAEGFAQAADGYCPALCAENLRIKAERALLDAAGEHFDGLNADRVIGSRNGLENWRKALDLLIGLVVNSPGYKNPLTGKVVK